MKIIRTDSHREQLIASLPFIIRKLAAAGLPRMWNHMMNSPFAIISAHKGSDSLSQEGRQSNNEKQRELKGLLGGYGLGFFSMKGLWEDTELGKYIPEDSLFIIGADKSTAKAISQLFDQQAFIWGDNGNFALEETESGDVWMDGKVEDYFRTLDQDDMDAIGSWHRSGEEGDKERVPGYSTIKGKRWVLDPDAKERAEKMRAELSNKKQPPAPIEQMASLRVIHPEFFFYIATKAPKQMKKAGILPMRGGQVPPRSRLDAFIVLRKV